MNPGSAFTVGLNPRDLPSHAHVVQLTNQREALTTERLVHLCMFIGVLKGKIEIYERRTCRPLCVLVCLFVLFKYMLFVLCLMFNWEC